MHALACALEAHYQPSRESPEQRRDAVNLIAGRDKFGVKKSALDPESKVTNNRGIQASAKNTGEGRGALAVGVENRRGYVTAANHSLSEDRLGPQLNGILPANYAEKLAFRAQIASGIPRYSYLGAQAAPHAERGSRLKSAQTMGRLLKTIMLAHGIRSPAVLPEEFAPLGWIMRPHRLRRQESRKSVGRDKNTAENPWSNQSSPRTGVRECGLLYHKS